MFHQPIKQAILQTIYHFLIEYQKIIAEKHRLFVSISFIYPRIYRRFQQYIAKKLN